MVVVQIRQVQGAGCVGSCGLCQVVGEVGWGGVGVGQANLGIHFSPPLQAPVLPVSPARSLHILTVPSYKEKHPAAGHD